MSETPTLATVVREAFQEALERVHTALPGRVERYDAATQTADVKLQVRDPDDVSLSVLPGVPVVFPRAGEAFLSFPIEVGHFVLVLFCEASIDRWRATGAESSPGDVRRHHLTAAVAIPGLYPSKAPLSDAHAENVVLGFDGAVQVHVKPDAVALGSENPTSGIALGVPTDSNFSAIDAFFRGLVGATPLTPSGLAALWAVAFPTPPASVESSVVKSD